MKRCKVIKTADTLQLLSEHDTFLLKEMLGQNDVNIFARQVFNSHVFNINNTVYSHIYILEHADDLHR